MFVTAEQNRANLRSAERIVAIAMGVEPDDNALSYEKREEFSKRIAAEILKYPDRFTSATLATAQRIAGTTYQPLADASFDWTNFAAETVKPGADALQNVGKGVLNTLNASSWAIPVAALALLGLLVWNLSRRAR